MTTQPDPDSSAKLTIHECKHLYEAADRARALHGPIGELVAREFMAWAEFGYRLNCGGLVNRAVDQINQQWQQRVEGLQAQAEAVSA